MRDKESTYLKDLWNRIMIYQTDFCIPLELSFYYCSEEWLRAKSVIDLGTGNGYYLKKIINRFPSKEYTAIDIDPYFINVARKRFRGIIGNKYSKVNFEVKDIVNAKGKYDFAVARLLVQHLKSIDSFFKNIAFLLKKKGSILIIDSYDSERKFFPELKYMKQLFDKLRINRYDEGCDRDASFNMHSIAKKYGFSLINDIKIIIPSTLGKNRSLFYKSYNSAFDIMKLQFKVKYKFAALKKELENWHKMENSYAQIGVHMVCYKKGVKA